MVKNQWEHVSVAIVKTQSFSAAIVVNTVKIWAQNAAGLELRILVNVTTISHVMNVALMVEMVVPAVASRNP